MKMTISASDKCVFLLGAGFSAAYGPPVMNAFMAKARRRYFELKQANNDRSLIAYYEDMLNFQSECLNSSWAFNRNWENIEELYTQADLLRLSEIGPSNEAENLCQSIAWSIWDIYRTADGQPDLQAVFKKVRAAKLDPIVITTNYDCVVEQAAFSAPDDWMSYFYPGFGIVDRNSHRLIKQNLEATPPPSCLHLIKLHGSANWFSLRRDEPEWVAVPTPLTTTGSGSRTLTTDEMRKWLWKETGRESEISPAIIPPMLGKASVAPVIALQWKAAIDALTQAREIWVVGYSFPATDTFMKRLLTEGVKRNRDLHKIWILDIQRYEDWRGRIEDLFPPVMRSARVEFVCLKAAELFKLLSDLFGTEPLARSLRQASTEYRRLENLWEKFP